MPLSPGVHFFTPTLSVHVFDAVEPGPTALVQAAIHGDEIAGAHAVFELLEAELRPARGRLILVPVMNPAAFRARQRAAPGGPDLNRCFPGQADAEALEHRLARRFLDLVLDERPSLMLTLHESQKRYDPDVHPSFGQSLVYGVSPMPPLIAEVIDRLNASLQDPNERWAPQSYPVATSSTEVIVDALDRAGTTCVGVCVETWQGFTLDRRVQMQRAVVTHFLDAVGMLPEAYQAAPVSR